MAKDLQLNLNMNGKLDPSFSAATKGARDQLAGVEAKTKDVIRAANQQASAKSWQAFSKSAGSAKNAVAGIGRELLGVGKAATGLVLGNGLLGASIYGVAKSSANYADAAIKNAQSVGMATSAFTEYAYAANMSGVAQTEFVAATTKLNKAMIDTQNGTGKAAKVFADLGVDIYDSSGNLKATEAMYAELSAAFAALPDDADKATKAAELFGRTAGPKMIPFLNAGREGINAMREDAIRLGISLSEADAKNAEAFNDSFQNISEAMRGATLIVGKELWPTLTKVHEFIGGKILDVSQELAVAIKGWDVAAWWDTAEPKFDAAWTSFKDGVKGVNDFAQSLGGWIPIAKTGLQIWLAYRGVRLAKSFWDAGKAVKAMSGDFLNLQYAGVSVGDVFASAGKSISGYAKTAGSDLKKWGETLYMISDTVFPRFTRSIVGGTGRIKTFAGLVGGKMLSAMTAVPKAFLAASGAVLKFGLALLLNPIGIAVAAIAGLGYAIYKCVKHWNSITAAAGKVWSVVKGVFAVGWSMLPGWVQRPLEKVAGFVGAIGGKIWSGIVKDWERVKAFFGPTLSAIGQTFANAWNSIAGTVDGALGRISSILGLSGDGWGKTLLGVWDSIAGVFSQKTKAIGGAFEDSFIGGLVETIKRFNPVTLFAEAFTKVKDWLMTFDLSKAAAAMMEKVKTGIQSAVVQHIPGGEYFVGAKDAVYGAADSLAGWLGIRGDGDVKSGDPAAAIPAMANGGIVTRPQLTLIGEAGPEVVIPVTRAARARELMGKAAEMMGVSRQTPASVMQSFNNQSMTNYGGDANSNITNKCTRFSTSWANSKVANVLPAITNVFGGNQSATANTSNQSWLSNIANAASSMTALSTWFGGTSSSATAFHYGGNVANSGGVLQNIFNSIIDTVPAYANGGFVDSPQLALIGEAGPEMVVPLNRENRARDLMGSAAEFMGWSGGESSGRGGDTFEFNFSPTIQITGGSENPERHARQISGSLEPLIRRIVIDAIKGEIIREQRTRSG